MSKSHHQTEEGIVLGLSVIYRKYVKLVQNYTVQYEAKQKINMQEHN